MASKLTRRPAAHRIGACDLDRKARAADRRIKGGAGKLLAELGFAPVGYRETIASRLPTTYELERLELLDDVPVIRQCRSLLTADGRAVETTVMVKGGHRFEVRFAVQL